MRIPLPESVKYIIETLQTHGYDAYAVGGCVRDVLLGRIPGDWDLTTSALPAQIKAVFRRTVDTGIAHGTVTVLHDSGTYEVTTFREDGTYADGRHPDSVRFVPCLKEDLLRRDFTINAMACNDREGLVDLYGGQKDLDEKIIRCVGDPMARFEEDALRMLRAVRFAAQLDFSIEPATLGAIRQLHGNLRHVSAERIQVELTKLLLSDHPESWRFAVETGLAAEMTDSALRLKEACAEGLVLLPKERNIRLAAFLRRLEAEKILRSLKYDNDAVRTVRLLVEELPKLTPPEPTALRHDLSRLGAELFAAKLTLQELMITLHDEIWLSAQTLEAEEIARILQQTRTLTAAILARGDCLTLKSLAVTGRDLLECGTQQGSRIGFLLNAALDLVLSDPGANQKERLMDYLEEHYGLHESV